MRLTATLTAINSRRDKFGNTYWALRFVDHETGKIVVGTVSGGESNIRSIMRFWNPDLDDWDRSIQFLTQTLPIREFNRLVKGWSYAGCRSEDLVGFIRQQLNNG